MNVQSLVRYYGNLKGNPESNTDDGGLDSEVSAGSKEYWGLLCSFFFFELLIFGSDQWVINKRPESQKCNRLFTGIIDDG